MAERSEEVRGVVVDFDPETDGGVVTVCVDRRTHVIYGQEAEDLDEVATVTTCTCKPRKQETVTLSPGMAAKVRAFLAEQTK